MSIRPPQSMLLFGHLLQALPRLACSSHVTHTYGAPGLSPPAFKATAVRRGFCPIPTKEPSNARIERLSTARDIRHRRAAVRQHRPHHKMLCSICPPSSLLFSLEQSARARRHAIFKRNTNAVVLGCSCKPTPNTSLARSDHVRSSSCQKTDEKGVQVCLLQLLEPIVEQRLNPYLHRHLWTHISFRTVDLWQIRLQCIQTIQILLSQRVTEPRCRMRWRSCNPRPCAPSTLKPELYVPTATGQGLW